MNIRDDIPTVLPGVYILVKSFVIQIIQSIEKYYILWGGKLGGIGEIRGAQT